MCHRMTVFSIEGHAVGAEHHGWMSAEDWVVIMREIDPAAHPLVHVTVDGTSVSRLAH